MPRADGQQPPRRNERYAHPMSYQDLWVGDELRSNTGPPFLTSRNTTLNDRAHNRVFNTVKAHFVQHLINLAFSLLPRKPRQRQLRRIPHILFHSQRTVKSFFLHDKSRDVLEHGRGFGDGGSVEEEFACHGVAPDSVGDAGEESGFTGSRGAHDYNEGKRGYVNVGAEGFRSRFFGFSDVPASMRPGTALPVTPSISTFVETPSFFLGFTCNERKKASACKDSASAVIGARRNVDTLMLYRRFFHASSAPAGAGTRAAKESVAAVDIVVSVS